MKCEQVKENGERCNANAMQGSTFCFRHNPETIEERAEASSKGGSVSKEQPTVRLEALDVSDPRQISILLADTINRVRKVYPDGSMDNKTATTIGFLAGKLLEAKEKVDMESRLEKLEQTVANS